jgi:hypothetical protein
MLYSKIEGRTTIIDTSWISWNVRQLENTWGAICDRRFSSSCWICVITEGVFSQEFSYKIMAKDMTVAKPI